MMKPRDYQLKFAEQAYQLLKEHGLAYLAMEERTGKTLTAILACEKTTAKTILVITKKKAIEGWQEHLQNFSHEKTYLVTNYHQVHKLNIKPDIVILDEAHSYISSFPKRSKIWQAIKKLTRGVPIIYISATPYAQGLQLLFNQFALCDWSPWRNYQSPYAWFRQYGIPNTIWLSGRMVETYTKVKTDELLPQIEPLFITATRKELGFEQEPEDKLHYIKLTAATKKRYNTFLKEKVLELPGAPAPLVGDTPMKLRTSLHMLEGGVAKIGSHYLQLPNTEKVDYILQHWGDSKDLVIMYNYVAEEAKLKQYFKKALILQATSYAEGIDLYQYKHLVIYSQNFSTAKFTQRRARQTNKQRSEPIIVHFLLVKNAISDQAYKTVSVNKENFVDAVFERREL